MMTRYKKKRKWLLVFGYTPLHNIFLESILSADDFNDFDVVLMNIPDSAKKNIVHKTRVKLVNVLKFFYYRLLLVTNSDVSILLPHPEHLLSNYYFYSRYVNNIYIYEDGLMNYLNVQMTPALLKRSRLRKIIAILLLYKFRIVSGYLSGCDERSIKGTYVQHPLYIYKPERHGKIKKIYLEKKQLKDTSKDTAIFIDQDIESIFSREQAAALRGRIYARLECCQTVYVKLHHTYESSTNKDRCCFPERFIMLPHDLQLMPAEKVVELIKPSSVWGFSSSSLINISSLYEPIECYSITPETFFVKTNHGDIPLSRIMQQFGVSAI